MAGILDKIKAEVEKMTPEQIKTELEKLKEHKEKQKEYRQGKGLSPEQLEKRAAYNKKRMSDPAVKEQMKSYRTKPENVEKRKAYQKTRNERQKAILAKAKELGLTAE